jgi:alanine racemase
LKVGIQLTILDQFSPRWVEVDLDAILHNLEEIRKVVGTSVKIMAVVKADAYGCGAAVVSRALVDQGVEWLAVTSIDEGIELRRKGIEARILVFSPLLKSQLRLAIDYDLTPTVNSQETAGFLVEAARERKKSISVHLKVETGMGRNGLFPKQAVELVEKLAGDSYLEVEGIYTHLSAAGSGHRPDQKYTLVQFNRLQQVIETLNHRGIRIPLCHVCNSAGLLAYPQMHLDMVRPGTILYGQYPSSAFSTQLNLKDPWRFKARIIQVQDYPRGSGIGYGRYFITRRPSRIGVLPVGFVDGYTLEPTLRPRGIWDLIKVVAKDILSWLGVSLGTQKVKVNGHIVSVVGKVAMQSCMIDVTGIPEIQVGSLVELTARRTTVSRRLPRLYLKKELLNLVTTPDGEEYPVGRPSI